MLETLLVEKFKQCLGSQYEIVSNDVFEQNFTRTVPQAPGQFQTYIQQDAFDKYKDKIVAVVSIQAAQYATTESLAINSTYTMTLWVPTNYKMLNAKGELLKAPKFNVEKDLFALRENLQNKTLAFGDKYRGELTFSEPVPVGNGYDFSGSFKRKTIVMSGRINLSEKHFYGRDYQIEIGYETPPEDLIVGGQGTNLVTFKQIKGLNSFNFTPQTTPIENHEQGRLIPEENIEAVKQVAVFSVDDSFDDVDLNVIFTKLALSGEQSKDLYILRVSKQVVNKKVSVEYPVYLTCSLTYQGGDSDTGIFTISCMRGQ